VLIDLFVRMENFRVFQRLESYYDVTKYLIRNDSEEIDAKGGQVDTPFGDSITQDYDTLHPVASIFMVAEAGSRTY
jgi:hypothetical protein